MVGNLRKILIFIKQKYLSYDFLDSNSGKIIFEKGSKLNQKNINEFLKKKINNLTIEESSLIGHYLASDIIDDKSGKIFYEAGFEIDEDFVNFINEKKINKIDLLKADNIEIGSYIRSTSSTW